MTTGKTIALTRQTFVAIYCPREVPSVPPACSPPFSLSLIPEILPGDQQVRSTWPCPLSHLALVCQGHWLVHPLLPFSLLGFPCTLCRYELDLSFSSGTSQTIAGDRCGQGHRHHSVLLLGAGGGSGGGGGPRLSKGVHVRAGC